MTLGVAAAAAGNAGIAGSLKACLDILLDISAAKGMESEWKTLQARLDIERTLLLQWADKVKLMSTDDYDKCLDDPAIHAKALKLLGDAQATLTDNPQLSNRFSIMTYVQEDGLPDASYLESAMTLSRSRMEAFNAEFTRQKLRVMRVPNAGPVASLSAASLPCCKFLLVSNDIAGFEKFTYWVAKLVNGLNKLSCTPNCLECSSQMAREDVRRVRSMDDLRLARDAAKGIRDTIAHSAEELLVHLARRRVLRNLWFRGMHERRATVQPPHPGTYEWAFKTPEIDTEWTDLGEWLESGSGIYWVCGKDGAGKSTLMNYILNHSETKRRLDAWGGNETVSVGSYFFWRMGSALQRTRDGLARALLYHILCEIPTLIPALVPTMWHYAYNGCVFESHEKIPLPSVSDVRMAFEHLAKPKVLDRRFCFIIDALDEYAGDEGRAVNFVQRMANCPKIKVIVATRPHPEFVSAFSTGPKLHLHDINAPDILQYVQDKADAHPHMQNLREQDETMSLILVETLAEKARGIFLWTVLATKALLKGFDAYEEMYELEERIQDVPEELEELFPHMLSLVEPRYREQAAKILRVCYRSKEERVDEGERGRTWTVGLAIFEEAGMELGNFDTKEVSLRARHKQCLALERRIASRCGGLLEIIRTDEDDSDKCFCGTLDSHPHHDILIDSSVEFTHLTIFEWFGGLDSWTSPYLEIQDDGFNADAALATMSWKQCYLAQQLGASFSRQDLDMANCMMYVQRVDNFSVKFADVMLYKIRQLVKDIRLKRGENWHYSFCCKVTSGRITERLETLYFAIGMGMVHFVKYYLKKHPDGPTLRELELQHEMEWWRVAADRVLVHHFLEPNTETIKKLSAQGPMLLYLAENECPVPSGELKHHLRAQSLESYGNLALTGKEFE